MVGGEALDDGLEVEVTVGNVDRDDAIGLEVAQVEGERLGGEEVDGDGVAAEGVEGEEIEVLRLLAVELMLQLEAGIVTGARARRSTAGLIS